MPVSSLVGAAYDAAAAAAGVRWISVDKPGYGASSPNRAGTLLGLADDVAALADHLGLVRFAVAGESGGGPCALAAAHGLGDRIPVCVVLAGMGPGHEPWARRDMKAMNKVLLLAAQRAPFLTRPMMATMAWIMRDDRRAARLDAGQTRQLPPADRAVHDEFGPIELAAVREAFAPGVAGAVQEGRLLARPWGFDLADLSCPVELWHGTADVNVPVALARLVAERIPTCRVHLHDGVGHSVGLVARDEVMALLASRDVR